VTRKRRACGPEKITIPKHDLVKLLSSCVLLGTLLGYYVYKGTAPTPATSPAPTPATSPAPWPPKAPETREDNTPELTDKLQGGGAKDVGSRRQTPQPPPRHFAPKLR
jgi:hypothetical protein